MFEWRLDEETGGVVIGPRRAAKAHEIAPVWVTELRAAGLADALSLGEETGVPVGIYCRGNYFYRGRKFARRRDDRIELIDRPTRRGDPLMPIDINGQAERNRDALDALESASAETMRAAIDATGAPGFNVAYSGGKDSEALLLLALRTDPSRIARVVFADTTEEFPQTYTHVHKRREDLAEWGIPLDIVRPPLDAITGWRLFGTPSRNVRWCCQVCKSGALSRIDHGGLPYVMGARGTESKYRAGYSLDAGRYSLTAAPTFRPLFDWSGAEVWLYLLSHGAPINNVYRYGHHRACCLACPFSSPYEVRITAEMAADALAPFRAEYERQWPGLASCFNHRYHGDGGTWGRVNSQALHGDFPDREKLAEGVIRYRLPAGEEPRDGWRRLAERLGMIIHTHRTEDGDLVQFFTRPHTRENALVVNLCNRVYFCVGCGYCVNYCENRAIRIDGNGVHIDIGKCSGCRRCIATDCLRSAALRGYRRP